MTTTKVRDLCAKAHSVGIDMRRHNGHGAVEFTIRKRGLESAPMSYDEAAQYIERHTEGLEAGQTAPEIDMLRARCATLLDQVAELTGLVKEFPSKLLEARLDARQDKQTVYDYQRAEKACTPKEY